MIEVDVNLYKTEPCEEDGKIRYVSSHGIVSIDMNELFDNIRKLERQEIRRTLHRIEPIRIIVHSVNLPAKMKEIGYQKGEFILDKSELVKIVMEQKRMGHDVELGREYNG